MPFVSRRRLSGIVLAAIVLVSVAACGPSAEQAPPPRYSISDSRSPEEVELIVLRDEQAGVEAGLAPAVGGELGSLRIRLGDGERDGEWIETLRRGGDYSPVEGFAGRAPLLWPAVGRSVPVDVLARIEAGETVENPGAWDYRGRRYPMPSHGFARDHPWTVVSREADERFARVVLSFSDNDQTRTMYPFGFELQATYTLVQGTLDVRYDLRASDANDDAMPFSIGNHITFKAPLIPGSDAAAMTLLAPSKQELIKSAERVPTGETRPRSHQVPVRLEEWEKLSAVSLTGFAGNHPMVLLDDPAGLRVLLSHNASRWPERPFIEFNVWGDAMDGFFSPEPWVGMQNSLVSGLGLIRLEPGETFDWTVHLEFERKN